ncbi:MAG: hypothetical protein PVJ57_09355 [Phycisphaerae bacterium]
MRGGSLNGQKRLAVLLVVGALVAAGGCYSSGPPRPPGPLPKVNVVLADELPYEGSVAAGDTRVVALCRSCDAFWKKTRGDWEYTWRVARYDVVAVEQGSWPDPTLSFIYWERCPTPESGIMLSQPPALYWKGVTLAFELDTTQTPAVVVGQALRHDPRGEPPTPP